MIFKPKSIPGILINFALVMMSFIFITLYISNMTSSTMYNIVKEKNVVVCGLGYICRA